MLRADNVICGTSTTGTGTLTLAACPSPPGGLDFDKWLKATGLNFVSTNAVLLSYTIIEYTDATFATAKQTEKGIGTLTLGASITAATLARTTVQSTSTGLNATPSPTYSAPTAITIGTAANTLIFVGASATDLMAFSPFVDATTSNATGYAGPLQVQGAGAGVSTIIQTSGTDYYIPFYWATPMLVKRIAVEVQTAYVGGVSDLYARIYAPSSLGQPGRLLYDFGALGTGAAALASANVTITSGASGNGFFLMPGVYFLDLVAIFSGGAGTPDLYGTTNFVMPSIMSLDETLAFVHGELPMNRGTATGGSSTAPTTANLTGYANSVASSGRSPGFGLKAS